MIHIGIYYNILLKYWQVPLVNALSNVGQEKEELLKGMEVMEITRLWFNSRLEQLALEQKQPAKTVGS